jgi:large subunit ribosomal protein L21
MYAVIQTGGKQYRVQQGDVLRVEKLAGDKGATVTFDKVLMLGGDAVKVGQPFVAGAKVTAAGGRARPREEDHRLQVSRRKNYRRKYGHRQPFTELKITGIEG